MLVAISIAESFSGMLPKFFVDVSKRFNDITFVRELAAIIIALTIGLSNVIDMVSMRLDFTAWGVLKSLLIFLPCKSLLRILLLGKRDTQVLYVPLNSRYVSDKHSNLSCVNIIRLFVPIMKSTLDSIKL